MTEPTLSQDVLAAELAEHAKYVKAEYEKQKQNAAAERAYRDAVHESLAEEIAALEARADSHRQTLAVQAGNAMDLEARVATLESVVGYLFDELRAVGSDRPAKELAEPEPLCPQGDLD